MPLPSTRPDCQQRCDFNSRYRRPRTDYYEARDVGRGSYPDAPVYFEEPLVRRRPPSTMCYNCGAPGHIARFCEHRQPSQSGRPASGFWRNDRRDPGAQWPAHATPDNNFWQRSLRNVSPASDRSLTPPSAPRPRRFPSPRRRLPSPPPGN